jgi:hypothetical protein
MLPDRHRRFAVRLAAQRMRPQFLLANRNGFGLAAGYERRKPLYYLYTCSTT